PASPGIHPVKPFAARRDDRPPSAPHQGLKSRNALPNPTALDPTVLFEDGGIAQLVHLPVGGAAHRWNERCIRAFPCTVRPKDLEGRAFLPATPIAGKA